VIIRVKKDKKEIKVMLNKKVPKEIKEKKVIKVRKVM
tara:strand:+ start:185 stop:295 length:111 start_codon:yes stop_codon:yes gene_type:complete